MSRTEWTLWVITLVLFLVAVTVRALSGLGPSWLTVTSAIGAGYGLANMILRGGPR